MNKIHRTLSFTITIAAVVCGIATSLTASRGQATPSAPATISGERKQWHKITLTLDGPFARESDTSPNPFTDYRLTVTFTHESGSPVYRVPGYFAADGDAGNTSADSGNKWRAHLSPDKPGTWRYAVSFVRGSGVAWNDEKGESVAPLDGTQGTFTVVQTDKRGRDLRAKGRLQYVGGHYLRWAGTGEYFLKAGADAPETLLGYADFDGTVARRTNVPLKTWEAHRRDWKTGDPTWKGEKGKGLIGALNYLASKGINSFSFLTYNAGGDGDNVWPFVSRDDKMHYDCSKLDQWGVIFEHAQKAGLYLHFKLQENEMDDNRTGAARKDGTVPEALDGGTLGPERKLYLRELIARYGYVLALNWNLGEENTQSPEEQKDMAKYIHDTDPYRHLIVIHTFPNQQDRVYSDLLGTQSELTGASLQNEWDEAHQRTLKWVTESEQAGKPWVVANDEQGPADMGVPPDPGYSGGDGVATMKNRTYTLDDIRKQTLWGNLMAGGAGVEYYFGYKLAQNDLVCEDWRSRDKSWDYCRIALDFFRDEKIPFPRMRNADALIGNKANDDSGYCFAQPGELYLVYLPKCDGAEARLDLSGAKGNFTVLWFNPRRGGKLAAGSVRSVTGGSTVGLGQPPADATQDWLVVVRR